MTRWCVFFVVCSVVSSTRRAVVTIDLTNEQAGDNAPKMYRREETIAVAERILGGGDDAPAWDAIFDCRNWIVNHEDSAYTDVDDSNWFGGVPGSEEAELIPRLKALRDAAELPNATTPKWKFVGKPVESCLYDTTMMHALLALKIDELYVTGINTNQCVFATVFDAWRSRIVDKVFIVEDACSSGDASHAKDVEEAHRNGLRMIKDTAGGNSRSKRVLFINSTDIPRHSSLSAVV